MIACGGCHTVIQNEKDEIYVCGRNEYGQLGLGDKKNRNIFEKVEKNFGKIKNISYGGNHTIIQNEKNEIYACGYNIYGQLGLGDNKNRNEFEKVKQNFGKIKNIICGYNQTVIQNEKDEIYVCGKNEYGQLGLGDNKNRNEFKKVDFEFGKIKKMARGGSYMIIQNEKNEMYICGNNVFNRMSYGDCGSNKFEKVNCNVGVIKNIACGDNHVIVQNEENEIYVYGNNKFGQLGFGNNKDKNKFEKLEFEFGKIKNIACGFCDTVIQNEKNEIYVCGWNYFGQFGFGDYYNRYKFEKVKHDFGEIKNIACRGYYTVIQNEKNEIYVCGNNRYGQLGLGDNERRNKFEKVDTYDIFEKIHNLELNTKEIVL